MVAHICVQRQVSIDLAIEVLKVRQRDRPRWDRGQRIEGRVKVNIVGWVGWIIELRPRRGAAQ